MIKIKFKIPFDGAVASNRVHSPYYPLNPFKEGNVD